MSDDGNVTNATPKKGGPKRKDWRPEFLRAFRENGNITQSAAMSGVSRQEVWRARKRSPKFDAACLEAEDEAADRLEIEARRRAVEGVEEPVFYKGDECGVVPKYSDNLLMFLLKGIRPEKYREIVDNRHRGQVEFKHQVDLSNVSDDDLATLEGIAKKITGSGGD